jgi:hypothetical protein
MQKPIILLLSLFSALKALNLPTMLGYMKNQPINKVYPSADGTKYIKLHSIRDFSRWDQDVYVLIITFSTSIPKQTGFAYLRVIKLFT